jgi:glycosyltransferase involved in cell wall biosynthesis
MARFTIITNITNGAGLQKDYELLKRMLESYGHEVRGEMFNEPTPTFRHADVNIFLEVVNPKHIPFAKQNWLVPNSEWWFDCWNANLPQFNKVLCKTHDCFQRWSQKVGGAKCTYIGFEANDYYRDDIKKLPTFLHLAGKSETKNTAAVIAAWRNHHLPYPLIVSAFKPEIINLTRGVPNVTQVDRFPDVIQVMNECRFHIMPSKNEGFGHALSEAAGCKGVIITTDAAPMNAKPVDKRLLIPVMRTVPRLMTQFYEVDPAAVAQRVHTAVQLPVGELERIGEDARVKFLSEREAFRAKFAEVVRASV